MADGKLGQSGAVSKSKQSIVYLNDYKPSNYLIDSTHLTFELGAELTLVSSKLLLVKNPKSNDLSNDLNLDGEGMSLRSITLDGRSLGDQEYALTDTGLTLFNVPDTFELQIQTEIDPAKNLALEGLYLSDGMYCTQCEAEGFRRITYFLDRPDVMSVFTTKIIADEKKYPILLSNGNLEGKGVLSDGRHWAQWQDPFKKPCYLFALVAGDLAKVEDHFVTLSGRKIKLQIFVEAKDLDKCGHAMRSLQHAMKWDEEVYGREYDLDLYMIVAVDFFNMGAMENKGLNIFNTSCILAHPATQTDAAFQRVEAVVAHEYFHNWSGNRVTCRDWFQLSLKEGFTVFRDACFSADMNSETVKRIEDVNLLRSAQFAEDAGPMSHPVQPSSYMEISNFYTLTIYEKGAEVIRMMHQLLGHEQFRHGTDLYFDRHDGQAVTCEDFVLAMEAVSGIDLSQFRRWYHQSGTPVVTVTSQWDSLKKTYQLSISQDCPPTAGQKNKEPFYIPFNVAFVEQDRVKEGSEQVLIINNTEQSFKFEGFSECPVPSLLRGFSAPVILNYEYSFEDLLQLISFESDGFVRWDASRRYMIQLIKNHVNKTQQLDSDKAHQQIDALASTLKGILNEGFQSISGKLTWCCNGEAACDAALMSEMLSVPPYQYIVEQFQEIDISSIVHARNIFRQAYIDALDPILESTYHSLKAQLDEVGEYRPLADDIALRSLKNSCLDFMLCNPSESRIALASDQFNFANNMTDQLSALTALINCQHVSAKQSTSIALKQFYDQWQSESLVVNQWFSVQASAEKSDIYENLSELFKHPAYDNTNPNKVRALLGAFCMRNPAQFHAQDGRGYRLLADEIIRLNQLNPQLASRMLAPFTQWKRYLSPHKELMLASLERISREPELSSDVYEVVFKSLA